MKWNHLQKALETYSMYLLSATRNNMPQYYELKDKISFKVDVSGNIFEVTFNAPEYWKYANYGRRPGKMPPVSAKGEQKKKDQETIEEWITRRQIVPESNTSTPNATSLAYAIARKIGREGTKGTKFLEKSLDEQKEYWMSTISSAIGEDILEEIDSWLSPLGGTVI